MQTQSITLAKKNQGHQDNQCSEEADTKVRTRIVQIAANITSKDVVQLLTSIVMPVGRKDTLSIQTCVKVVQHHQEVIREVGVISEEEDTLHGVREYIMRKTTHPRTTLS